jgi:hypothetical protein
MGFFKTIAKKVIGNSLNKKIDQSNLSADEKRNVKTQTSQSVDLLSENFEGHAKGSLKALAAFITSIPGGPVAAFSAAASVALKEANANEQKFIQGHIDRGIPISVNGQLISPVVSPPEEQAAQILSNAWLIGGALLVSGTVAIILLFSPDQKNKKSHTTKKAKT